MELSEQEREKIRQEEFFRLQLHKEMKRKRRPRLIVLALLWTVVLAVLAFVSPHLHY